MSLPSADKIVQQYLVLCQGANYDDMTWPSLIGNMTQNFGCRGEERRKASQKCQIEKFWKSFSKERGWFGIKVTALIFSLLYLS